jgi:hypothetical protein
MVIQKEELEASAVAGLTPRGGALVQTAGKRRAFHWRGAGAECLGSVSSQGKKWKRVKDVKLY